MLSSNHWRNNFAQASKYATEIAEEHNHLLIMKGYYQLFLDNKMLSDDKIGLAQMYEEEGINENYQQYLEGKR